MNKQLVGHTEEIVFIKHVEDFEYSLECIYFVVDYYPEYVMEALSANTGVHYAILNCYDNNTKINNKGNLL